ncbi:MAG: bifunctional phosphoserine phosphatase/homoserine phosphotransferase ThrH [Proteobacteria bacterium]|jgi:phosphoserine/homoserine phosphotransferase|nr:bifunctional phosphoserine phosphatase/homoserine phosphotransferase ThrH [Pseudomonadota bacterium]MDA0976841.1 bifunctional phosphoserine phosphatase/homoserine phosphotransferase ThrH [Pseudomonadota bacterium]MDA1037981.1 bifunctional phosphoserine phosphatase/homoserine phosphotransferase ThrH [Pseudomonadota bacterium]
MEIACFDMEGTLTPEIWEQIASNTGIEEFNKTTRDIPDYSDLMDFRLKVMKENNLKLSDIQKASGELELLDGAAEFLSRIRENFQVVILSDTFHEIAKPLIRKMGFPLLLCHNLEVNNDEVISYKLRHKQAKKQAILSFQSIGYRCIAAGDSFNDIQMFEVAESGFFINAPDKISSQYPDIPSFHNYDDLENAIKNSSIFI